MRTLLQNLIGTPVVNNTVTVSTVDALGNPIVTVTETGFDIEYIAVYLMLLMTLYFTYSILRRLMTLHLRGKD